MERKDEDYKHISQNFIFSVCIFSDVGDKEISILGLHFSGYKIEECSEIGK